MRTPDKPPAWARLEAMLTAMHTGDVITVDDVIAKTRIEVESVEVALDSLVRAHLFERHGQQFMRVSLLGDAAEQKRAFGALLRHRDGCRRRNRQVDWLLFSPVLDLF